MAVHIFRVGLTGKLLFPEEILSYINFRSTAIYLLKKKKRKKKTNLYPKEQEWKKKNCTKAGKHHYTPQARAQRQEE